MKLADLKRIPVGTRLRLVRSFLGPCDKPREVAKVQSNSIALKQLDKALAPLSWLTFPKASDFRDDGDGFTVLEDGEIAAQYKFDGAPSTVAAEPVTRPPVIFPVQVWCAWIGWQGGTIHEAFRTFRELPAERRAAFLAALVATPGLVDHYAHVADFRAVDAEATRLTQARETTAEDVRR